eukprot:2156174-Prymnesium_polylepis.2
MMTSSPTHTGDSRGTQHRDAMRPREAAEIVAKAETLAGRKVEREEYVHGWSLQLRARMRGQSAGQYYVCFTAPDGFKLRSIVQLRRHLLGDEEPPCRGPRAIAAASPPAATKSRHGRRAEAQGRRAAATRLVSRPAVQPSAYP